MPEYASNSHRSKTEAAEREKRVEKVVKSKASTIKNNGRKFTNIFVSEDASSVKKYVIEDVLIPTAKDTISNIVKNVIDIILFGESQGNRSRSKSKVSYRSYYDDEKDKSRATTSSRSRFDYDDIKFETRAEAEEVRDQMDNVIETYGHVTVADMYDMADLTAPYTANDYGWKSVVNADIVRARDGGWILKLPNARPIN